MAEHRALTRDDEAPGGPKEPPEQHLGSVGAPLIQILGLFLTVGAFLAWRAGDDVRLPTLAIVIAVGVLLVGAAFAWRGDAILRFVVGGHWLAVSGVFALLCACLAVAVVLLPPVELTLSTLPVAIVGVVSLVGPMVEGWQHRRAAARRERRRQRLFNEVLGFLSWQVPLAAVLLVLCLLLAELTRG